jgi:hypothetical protein
MLRPFLAAIAAVSALSGCYSGHAYGHHHHHPTNGSADLAVASVGLVASAAILAAEIEHTEHVREREAPTTYYNVVYVNSTPDPVTPPSARDRVQVQRTKLAPFAPSAARSALAKVDVDECRSLGAPRAYGHAVVTFNPDGHASKVVVDTPSGLPDEAVKCIGDRLGAVRVAEFDGSLVTVGTTWFVR